MLTDTHCHLNLEAFDADRPAVVERALQAGVARILVPGTTVESSRACIELAEGYPQIFAAAGIHPTEADRSDGAALDELRVLAQHPKVVAIGEIGLDYYWVTDADQQSHQRDLLRQQLRLATELRKPVILHCRERGDVNAGPCVDDLLSILEQWQGESGKRAQHAGVLHSFAGSLQKAERAVEMGFLIGVTGPVTYKNAAQRREMISSLALESLLIETDSPYLAPEPHRGRRNEPAYVAHIADKIAAILTSTPQEVATVTAQNADRLFAWGETA